MNEKNSLKVSKLYTSLAKSLSKIYDYMVNVPSFNLDKADVLKSFDHYFEAFTILNLYHCNNLTVDYFKFVKNLVLYHDLFADYDVSDYNEDFVIPILNICKDVIVEDPAFIKMISIIDKEMEASISSAESFASTIHESFNHLSEIINKESSTEGVDNKLLSILEKSLKKFVVEFTKK